MPDSTLVELKATGILPLSKKVMKQYLNYQVHPFSLLETCDDEATTFFNSKKVYVAKKMK